MVFLDWPKEAAAGNDLATMFGVDVELNMEEMPY